jgi:hypothetical protein
VLQPVTQLGTAVHGESFSKRALNGVQKLMHAESSSPSNVKNGLIYRSNFNSPAHGRRCGRGHTERACPIQSFAARFARQIAPDSESLALRLPLLIRTPLGTPHVLNPASIPLPR